MSTARQYLGSGGSDSSNALAFGNPASSAATEEWDAPSTFTKQIQGQLFFNSTANAFKETITDIPGATWAWWRALTTKIQKEVEEQALHIMQCIIFWWR